MKYYDSEIEITRKSDDSPVTIADLAANQLIVEALVELAPDTPILSEEQADHRLAPEVRCFWSVDPLDGTKSFIRKKGEFTVNIALIDDGLPVLGVIYIPTDGMLYAGAVGQPAYRQQRGELPQSIQVSEVPASGLRAVVSSSHLDAQTNAFLQQHAVSARLAVASSIKFCRVAEGAADIYPRFGSTMQWDTAAGHAIVLAAGGRVETPEGEVFRYDPQQLRNGAFIVYGA